MWIRHRHHHRSGRGWRKLVVPASAVLALAGAGVTSASAAEPNTTASAGNAICSGGDISGAYRNLLVTGLCQVPAGATLTVNGQVLVRGPQAVLLSEFAPAYVTINGPVMVDGGGLLALGTLNEGSGCAPSDVASSTVNGDVVAVGALSLKIDCTTINGNVVSQRGGVGGFRNDCESALPQGQALNFVVKDNLIKGNVLVNGWQGCWLGLLRNIVTGNVALLNNHPADVDAMEVVTNGIGRNLGCWRNTPHPQVGDALGPTPPPPPYNLVGGHEFGQCQGL